MQFSSFKVIIGAALLSSSIAAHAVSVDIGGCNGGTSGSTTCEAGSTVINFNSGSLPSDVKSDGGGGGRVVTGSLSGQYATPAGDSTAYLAIPASGTSGTVEVTPGSQEHYFGIEWGSIDSFNTITFLDDGKVVGSYTGSQIIADASLAGNQVASGSNEYVNFYFGKASYDTVLLSSTNYAFESDNLAFSKDCDVPGAAGVPEPLAAGLLGLGLLGAGFSRRRSGAKLVTA